MRTTRAAKRYAGALLSLSTELKKVDEIASDMRFIHDSISASHELDIFFRSPIVDRFKKRAVMKALFEGKIDKMTMHFLTLLVDKGREDLTDAIAVEFASLHDKLLGIVNAELKAPFRLDERTESQAKSKLEELTSKKVRVSFSLDRSLVGGFLARVGDTVYDGSVRRQLEILRQQLSEQAAFQS